MNKYRVAYHVPGNPIMMADTVEAESVTEEDGLLMCWVNTAAGETPRLKAMYAHGAWVSVERKNDGED